MKNERQIACEDHSSYTKIRHAAVPQQPGPDLRDLVFLGPSSLLDQIYLAQDAEREFDFPASMYACKGLFYARLLDVDPDSGWYFLEVAALPSHFHRKEDAEEGCIRYRERSSIEVTFSSEELDQLLVLERCHQGIPYGDLRDLAMEHAQLVVQEWNVYRGQLLAKGPDGLLLHEGDCPEEVRKAFVEEVLATPILSEPVPYTPEYAPSQMLKDDTEGDLTSIAYIADANDYLESVSSRFSNRAPRQRYSLSVLLDTFQSSTLQVLAPVSTPALREEEVVKPRQVLFSSASKLVRRAAMRLVIEDVHAKRVAEDVSWSKRARLKRLERSLKQFLHSPLLAEVIEVQPIFFKQALRSVTIDIALPVAA